jgi:hypothetical protein
MTCWVCWGKVVKVYLLSAVLCSKLLSDLVNVSAQEEKVLPSILIPLFLVDSLNIYVNEGSIVFAADACNGIIEGEV